MRSKSALVVVLASVFWFSPTAATEITGGYDALVAEDFSTAARLFEAEAQNGDAFALLGLGYLYRIGRGISVADSVRSANLIQEAAETGNCEAQYIIGTYYFRGFGRALDEKIALDWFKRSALCGHSGAQLAVAQIYFEQISLHDQALAWLRASAFQDHPHSLVLLADHYLNADDLSEGSETAMHLYLLSADQGYPIAAQRIADVFERGTVLPPDPMAAEHWQELATQLAQARYHPTSAGEPVETPGSGQGATLLMTSKADLHLRASKMATALLKSFPQLSDPFINLPHDLSVKRDPDPLKLLPDNQYGIPRRTFIIWQAHQ